MRERGHTHTCVYVCTRVQRQRDRENKKKNKMKEPSIVTVMGKSKDNLQRKDDSVKIKVSKIN